MTVILRSSSPTSPLLDPRTMQHIQRCAVAYEEYKHERDELSDPEDDEGPDNDEAWVFEDLHVLLRILTKARDKEQMIELIFEVSPVSLRVALRPRREGTLIVSLCSGDTGKYVRGSQGHRHHLL
jgi:hypothetical protein